MYRPIYANLPQCAMRLFASSNCKTVPSFGLSYLMQGDTLRDMLQGRAAPLAGQCSLAMARKFALSASSWPGWRTLLA